MKFSATGNKADEKKTKVLVIKENITRNRQEICDYAVLVRKLPGNHNSQPSLRCTVFVTAKIPVEHGRDIGHLNQCS